MRIARLVQYFQPQFGYSDLYLMNTFKRLGHEVCIITSNLYSPDVKVFSNSIERKIKPGKYYEDGLLVYRLPTLFEISSQPVNLFGLDSILEEFKPDVIHSNDLFWSITFLAAYYKRKIKYKLFIDSITGTFNPVGYKKIIFNLMKLLYKYYLKKNVDRFFAICEGSKRWIVKNLSISDELVEVIPLGADMNLFKPNVKIRQHMRNNLNLKDDEIVLVYSGKILPNKDIDILLMALALVVLNSPNVKLLIIGNGPPRYLNYLKALIERLKIKENVIFIPTVKRKLLPYYYNAADIAVWPGDPSISIVEAMANGLPIILCHYQFPRDDAFDTSHLLKHGNGLSFPRGDYLALKECIRKLIYDENIRKEMGAKSRRLVENELNWDSIARKYLKAYEKA